MAPQAQLTLAEASKGYRSETGICQHISRHIRMTRSSIAKRSGALAILAVGLFSTSAHSQSDSSLFNGQWTLDTGISILSFQSVKNNAVIDSNRFASFSGSIDENGLAALRIQLDSVDTGIDLYNVRMRFLFFETYNFPEAIISTQLEAPLIRDLKTKRHMATRIKFDMELHGLKSELEADVTATLISDNRVSVSSTSPILIEAKLFGMEENVRKLEDAANVEILPAGSVSFNLVFANANAAPVTDAPQLAIVAPTDTAVETKGDFTAEACRGRFEVLSRTGAIYFRTGSAVVEQDSAPFLKAVYDIARRCPDLNILVSGHTDSEGEENLNQLLSEARAYAVMTYLSRVGVSPTRLRAIGHGETRPVVDNDTPRNRGLNRRIEFSVDDG